MKITGPKLIAIKSIILLLGLALFDLSSATVAAQGTTALASQGELVRDVRSVIAQESENYRAKHFPKGALPPKHGWRGQSPLQRAPKTARKIPGGVGWGIYFFDDALLWTNSTIADYYVIAPNVLGQPVSFLYLTSTCRAQRGTESLIAYDGTSEPQFWIFDWANPNPWQVQIDLPTDNPQYLTVQPDEFGVTRQMVHIRNGTYYRGFSGGVYNWENKVMLYNFNQNLWDLVYTYDYSTTNVYQNLYTPALDSQGTEVGHWGPIIETFDTYTNVNPLGFDRIRLFQDGDTLPQWLSGANSYGLESSPWQELTFAPYTSFTAAVSPTALAPDTNEVGVLCVDANTNAGSFSISPTPNGSSPLPYWTVTPNGNEWENTVVGLTPGQYTITFSAPPNLLPPPAQAFKIAANTITTVQATFGASLNGGAQTAIEADSGSDSIYALAPGGSRSLLATGFGTSDYGLAFNSSGILFASDINGNIYKFSSIGSPPLSSQVFASGLNDPYGLAFDSSDDLFVADNGSGNLYKFTPAGVRTTFASGLVNPTGVAIDASGNIWLADRSSIYEYTPNGSRTIFATGLSLPFGLAFDNAGTLWFAEYGNGDVYYANVLNGGGPTLWRAGMGALTGIAFDSSDNMYLANNAGSVSEYTESGVLIQTYSGLNHPVFLAVAPPPAPPIIVQEPTSQYLYEVNFFDTNVYEFTSRGVRSVFVATTNDNLQGIAFNSAGDLFVANNPEGVIYEYTPAGTQSVFASGLNQPWGLAFNESGNLFEADWGSGNIYEFTANGTQSTFASGLDNPWGLAFDSAGDLFEADSGSGTVYEFAPDGTQSVYAYVPSCSGLVFDSVGNLYVASLDYGTITEITTNGTQSTFASGFDTPTALAIDNSGNIYVSSGLSSGTVTEIAPNGTQSVIASGLNYPNGLAFENGPALESVPLGDSANFTVSATGALPLYYQWYFNGNALPGATNASLAISPSLINDDGYYELVVTNYFGSVTSIVGSLSVVVEPNIVGISNNPSSGSMTLSLASYPNSTNYLYAATNLALPMAQWQLIATKVAGINGLFQFADTNIVGVTKRFYRLSDQLMISITNVSSIVAEQHQTITISGTGFGTNAPYNGDSDYIYILDNGRFEAGSLQAGNDVYLDVTSWTDNQIVISGFTGYYGYSDWFLDSGDPIVIAVWNPQTGAGPATASVTVSSP